MEKDIRSIMELLQKGIITPEEAEKMIKEIQGTTDYSRKATETAKNIGEKIGGVIDDIAPKTKGVLKSVFQATADFSQKMANKMDDETQGFGESFFNRGSESDFESDFDDAEFKTEVKEEVKTEVKEEVKTEVKREDVVNTTDEDDEEHYNDVGIVQTSLFETATSSEHIIEIEKL